MSLSNRPGTGWLSLSRITWVLASALILFTSENIWLERIARSRWHRIPSLVPEQGTTAWALAFAVIGTGCALLLVCLVFLLKRRGLRTVGSWGALVLTATAVVLSAHWFKVTGIAPPKPHSVALSWQASTSSDVLGYNIYRQALPNGRLELLNPGLLVRELSFLDENVEAGVRYRYTVRAFAHGQESVESNAVEVKVPWP